MHNAFCDFPFVLFMSTTPIPGPWQKRKHIPFTLIVKQIFQLRTPLEDKLLTRTKLPYSCEGAVPIGRMVPEYPQPHKRVLKEANGEAAKWRSCETIIIKAMYRKAIPHLPRDMPWSMLRSKPHGFAALNLGFVQDDVCLQAARCRSPDLHKLQAALKTTTQAPIGQ